MYHTVLIKILIGMVIIYHIYHIDHLRKKMLTTLMTSPEVVPK